MQISDILLRILLFIFVVIGDLVFLIAVGMGFDAGVSWWAVAFALYYFSIAIPLPILCWIPKETLSNPPLALKIYYYYLGAVVGIPYAISQIL